MKKQIIWSVIVISVIVILALLIGFSSWISVKSDHNLRLPIHKTLYIDRSITDQHLAVIAEACNEWYKATNGQVIFDIIKLPCSKMDPFDSVVIINVSPDYPEVILLDQSNENTTLGYFDDIKFPTIGLVDQRLTDDKYLGVIEHELAHALQMQHVAGIGSLMNPNYDLGSNHITQSDLIQFCQIYNCK